MQYLIKVSWLCGAFGGFLNADWRDAGMCARSGVRRWEWEGDIVGGMAMGIGGDKDGNDDGDEPSGWALRNRTQKDNGDGDIKAHAPPGDEANGDGNNSWVLCLY